METIMTLRAHSYKIFGIAILAILILVVNFQSVPGAWTASAYLTAKAVTSPNLSFQILVEPGRVRGNAALPFRAVGTCTEARDGSAFTSTKHALEQRRWCSSYGSVAVSALDDDRSGRVIRRPAFLLGSVAPSRTK